MSDIDRRVRWVFYIISFILMLGGWYCHWNAWLVGGGLAVFLVVLNQDAKDERKIKSKSDGCNEEEQPRRLKEDGR